MGDLDTVRRHYAEKLRAIASLHSEALVRAFAKVPREHFLGTGPWQIIRPAIGPGREQYEWSEDAHPRRLYQDVLVAIDPSRNLNNGQPSAIASWLDALELCEGERVIHIGCGVGYYSAIMAEAVGESGHIVAIEIDANLASRARKNLAYLRQVEVLFGDGAEYNPGPTDAIFVNAGVTHPQPVWLDSLPRGGRLILPITIAATPGSIGKGGTLKVKREPRGYSACFLSPVRVFSCVEGRDVELNKRLFNAFELGNWQLVQSLRREAHEPGSTCWLHGDNFCISTLPLPTN